MGLLRRHTIPELLLFLVQDKYGEKKIKSLELPPSSGKMWTGRCHSPISTKEEMGRVTLLELPPLGDMKSGKRKFLRCPTPTVIL